MGVCCERISQVPRQHVVICILLLILFIAWMEDIHMEFGSGRSGGARVLGLSEVVNIQEGHARVYV